MVTRRVEGALDLGAVLAMARRGEIRRRVLQRVERALGALVRELHDLGCLHADLTPSNVLAERSSLDQGEPTLWIIDLDRACMVPEVSDAERRANIARLYRFIVRRERYGRLLARSDHARVLRGYDPASTRWKDDWKAIAALHDRGRVWHAMGWRLEEMWSRRADLREAPPR